MFNKIINYFYHNRFSSYVFHTVVSCLQNELRDCNSVLDIGCGPNSPIQHCKKIKYSIGVEAYKPYLAETRKKGIHNMYINALIENLDFSENSFDAVVLIEVLEHLPKKLGKQIIKKAEKWARKKVIITTPNGYVSQTSLDDNKLQMHLSGWTVKEFNSSGYRVKGLSGLKSLRQETPANTMGDNLLVSIKYRPKIFWFFIATLSQIFTYVIPEKAFELFCIYRKNN